MLRPWWKKKPQVNIEKNESFTVLTPANFLTSFDFYLRNNMERYAREAAYKDFTNENMSDFFDHISEFCTNSLIEALKNNSIPLMRKRKKWWQF